MEGKNEETLDNAKINDVLLNLQNFWNTQNREYAERAEGILSSLLESTKEAEKVKLVRADKVVFPDGKGFISTGLDWLDEILGGGMRRQEIFGIGLPPGHGKSHWLTFLSGIYIKQGLKVAHFNGEDILADIDESYYTMLKESKYREQIYFADVRDGFTTKIIDEALTEAEVKPDFIVVDHLDCMDSEGSGQDWLEAGHTATKLRKICKKHNVFGLIASQIDYGNNGNHGMQRLHRGKVSKASPFDVFWIADAVVDQDYLFSTGKSKGRNIKSSKKKFAIRLDFETMRATKLAE